MMMMMLLLGGGGGGGGGGGVVVWWRGGVVAGGGWWVVGGGWWWWYKVIEPLYNMEKHGHLHDSGDTIWQSIQSPVWVDDFPLYTGKAWQPAMFDHYATDM